jgi:hypothetical protein
MPELLLCQMLLLYLGSWVFCSAQLHSSRTLLCTPSLVSVAQCLETVWWPYPSGFIGPLKGSMVQWIFFIGPSILEDETTTRSRNVAQRTPSDGAQCSGIADWPTAPLWRPEYLFYIVSYRRKIWKTW